jgi:hypothetical protein
MEKARAFHCTNSNPAIRMIEASAVFQNIKEERALS